jgi:hypothetical protein
MEAGISQWLWFQDLVHVWKSPLGLSTQKRVGGKTIFNSGKKKLQKYLNFVFLFF